MSPLHWKDSAADTEGKQQKPDRWFGVAMLLIGILAGGIVMMLLRS